MKFIPSTIFLFICLNCSSQNNATNKEYFSLGSKTTGICFGHAKYYNGLRLNLWDKELKDEDTSLFQINGLAISFANESKVTNGIQIGLVASHTKIINGISIASIANNAKKINGIATSFVLNCDTMNGLFLGFGIGPTNGNIDNTILTGLAIGVLTDIESSIGIIISLFKQHSKKQRGLSIAALNKADELKGLQIGLLNYAGNNPKLVRWLPFINFHF
ncbi:MAG: hypothetical protein IPJ43_11250 [Saprospiraceae bacterium]|nr:hypothetical protein [Saprospiraceae bacterium]